MENRTVFTALAYIFYIIGFLLLRYSPSSSRETLFVGGIFIIIGIICNAIGGFEEYRHYERGNIDFFPFNDEKVEARRRRLNALTQAQIFLLPYKDIWSNLTLSNKLCSFKLRPDGVTMIGTEKVRDVNSKARSFRVVSPGILDTNELFNMFCLNFEYNTSYDGLKELCNRCRVTIKETGDTKPDIPAPVVDIKTKKTTKLIPEADKTDVNNCSEIELTALPGISIVIAKKIVKRREEIKGFKSVDDFLKFVNLKPNITNQLNDMVVVKKMQGSLHINRNKERTVDL